MGKKYYKRAYKRVVVQERDREIMNYCLEQKFLTVEQISKRFFRPGAQVKNKQKKAYERVLVLRRFGLMALEPIYTGEKVVQTTQLGASELLRHGYEPLPVLQGVDYRYFEHDRRVGDFRIILENLGLTERWVPERRLKQRFVGKSRVPDALLNLVNGQTIALEVEIARKGKRRYEQIFDEYALERYGNVDLVLYLCNTMPQVRALSKLTKRHEWIYYGLYERMIEDKLETVLGNSSDWFRLSEIKGAIREAG